MGTDVKPNSLPDLDDLLQCPVCYEIPTGQIFQCNEGHHVCGRCKARLAQCPVCRALFFGTRNYAMEELIANVRKLQAFKLGGKMTITSGSESTASADNSVAGITLDESVEDEETDDLSGTTTLRAPAACKGLFRCLCCKNGNSERLPAARLLNHLRYFHGRDLLEGKSEGGEYVQAWQIATVPGRIVIAVRVADMGVFFLIIEINNNSIYSWVSMAAAPLIAHEFNYTVIISGNDREAIFTDCVWSVRSCEGALKKRGRCLVVNGADVLALTASANVSGRLALRRAPADQLAQPAQPRAVLRVANRGSQPAIVAHEPDTIEHLEPFVQDSRYDMRQISRAFATHGRINSTLARSEAEDAERQQAARNEVEPPPETPTDERPHLSRSARRRMRLRLRSALNAPQPAPSQSTQRPSAQPQQRAEAHNQQRVQQDQRPSAQQQQRTNQHQQWTSAQSQHVEQNSYITMVPEHPREIIAFGPLIVQPASVPVSHSGPSNSNSSSANENRGNNNNNNKKKRRQRR